MVVAKRKKPVKIKQRKVQGPEWEPQVKQTALLASPIYIGQAQGEEKKYIKRGAKIGPGASCLFMSFQLACPHASRLYFPLLSKWNWAVTWSCNSGPSEGCNAGPSLQIFIATRQNRGNYTLSRHLFLLLRKNYHQKFSWSYQENIRAIVDSCPTFHF